MLKQEIEIVSNLSIVNEAQITVVSQKDFDGQMLDAVNSLLVSEIVPKNWEILILCMIRKIIATIKCDELEEYLET